MSENLKIRNELGETILAFIVTSILLSPFIALIF